MRNYPITQLPKEEVKVKLERFEKIDLERNLDVIYGIESDKRLIYNDIEKTYLKFLFEKGTTNITIITDLIEEQIYKFADFEVNIKNEF
jgi:hypothetical protein